MTEAETPDDRYRAPALDKGLDILELLSCMPKGLTRGEIVKAMDRKPSEIYRMLERLVARDYVRRDGDRYELSMKMFMIANRHPPLRRLTAQALPLMDRFAMDSRQSCHLVVADRGAGLVIAQVSPPDTWEFKVRIGAELDLLTTGSGQALLAFQSPQQRRKTLEVWRDPAHEVALALLDTHFTATRATGYRKGTSQQLTGVTDISFPIFDITAEAMAVITCAFTHRLDHIGAQDETEVAFALDAMAKQLSITE